jgi:hypothetical protein
MDSRGANLNRFYDRPSLELHPSIFASRALCLHHHSQKQLEFYIDLHAHAGKRGCFIFGNALDGARQESNVSYAKLVSISHHIYQHVASMDQKKKAPCPLRLSLKSSPLVFSFCAKRHGGGLHNGLTPHHYHGKHCRLHSIPRTLILTTAPSPNEACSPKTKIHSRRKGLVGTCPPPPECDVVFPWYLLYTFAYAWDDTGGTSPHHTDTKFICVSWSTPTYLGLASSLRRILRMCTPWSATTTREGR